MSTLPATLPGPAHSLFAEVSRFFAAMIATPNAAATTKTNAAVATPAAAPVIWKLFLMSAGMNSINPALFIDRIVQD